ncbi:MAG: zinc-binding alcohol dehydrogenase family protein [Oceanicoccus sp.]|jgi:zinc-binding alcohol dehydrogenase family protein
MKAFAFDLSLPIEHADSLIAIEQDIPTATGCDLLVKIDAISINPVDAKLRQRLRPEKGEPKVLGYDAVGTVSAVGDTCTLFKVGDKVFYAGDMSRQGSNAEFQLVDERIVGKAPTSISNAEIAALPLTAITAYEMLFDRLQVDVKSKYQTSQNAVLVTGGAGGVGSIMIQLLKALNPEITVIATASRKDTQAWCKRMGADHVINHSNGIASELKKIGVNEVSHIASITHTHLHFEDFAEVIKPQGKICLIDNPPVPLNIDLLKSKSVSLHWEFMFTRSLFNTEDMIKQHHIFNEVADLIDSKKIATTLGKNLGKINLDNLKLAHQLIESNQSIGKIVLEGF